MVVAKDVMSTEFVKVDVDETISRLLGRMKKERDTVALVFDKDVFKGVLSKKWLLSSRIDTSTMKVNNILKHRTRAKSSFFVPQIAQSTVLKEVCRLLATADVRALPVVEKKKVIGIVCR